MVLGVYVHKQETERLKKNTENYRDCMIVAGVSLARSEPPHVTIV